MMRIPKIKPKPADYNERRAEQMMRPTQWALGTLAAVGLATALTAGAAWGYGKLAEPISDGFTKARDAATARLENVVTWDQAKSNLADVFQGVFTEEPRMYGGDLAYFTQMAGEYRDGVDQSELPTFNAITAYLERNPDVARSLPDDVRTVYLGDE